MGTDALKQQQDLINAYQPGGTAALASQQQLLGQLGQQAVGQGPNPAQNQLNQATAANTANTAALMAGQRGSSQNAGLIARQAGQQGAQNQQQAAGQAATMNAQQQIAARQQLAAQQAQMVGQQQQGQQQYTGNVLGALAGQNANQTSLAKQQMQGQSNLLGNVMGAIGTGVGMLSGGPAGAAVGSQVGKNFSTYMNGGQWQADQQQQNAGYASGGEVGAGHMPNNLDMMNEGGQMPQLPMAQGGGVSGPQSKLGQHFAGMSSRPMPQAMPSMQPMPFAQGGKVPALVSPGEQYIPPQEVKAVAEGKKNPLKTGERIPGKPKVPGAVNSYANDTVKRNLDEGGVVIPRSIMQGPNPHWEAMRFVHAHTRSLKKG